MLLHMDFYFFLSLWKKYSHSCIIFPLTEDIKQKKYWELQTIKKKEYCCLYLSYYVVHNVQIVKLGKFTWKFMLIIVTPTNILNLAYKHSMKLVNQVRCFFLLQKYISSMKNNISFNFIVLLWVWHFPFQGTGIIYHSHYLVNDIW